LEKEGVAHRSESAEGSKKVVSPCKSPTEKAPSLKLYKNTDSPRQPVETRADKKIKRREER